ncbi:MAG: hypothetical protein FWG74_04920 [Planctomycetes bacterium]|nr:hypothetical protein [Planctomycetota bacterium]
MKITKVQAWKTSPPNDCWHLLSIDTDRGLTGWGEYTGSGHDAAATAICHEAAFALLGADPLDIAARLDPYRRFSYPPRSDKLLAVAWSGMAQALWDIQAQAWGIPLYRLLGGNRKEIPLYANLNRGLFGDRSPAGHAKHTEQALAAGFAAAKCTPFDEVAPQTADWRIINSGLDRLRAATGAAGETRLVAVDCHRRFSADLAGIFLERLGDLGAFRWVEDLLDTAVADQYPAFRRAFPCVTWASGEETCSLAMALDLVCGAGRPDIFMPDVKYICGLDAIMAVCRAAEAKGCRISPHNPSGPVSQAFSAHMASACREAVVEYPYLSVPDRADLTTPAEPVIQGRYILSDRPGLGLAPSRKALEKHSLPLFAVS